MRALVAQGIERKVADLEVGGSNPSERAMPSQRALVAQWTERLRPKEGVGGSIPSEGANTHFWRGAGAVERARLEIGYPPKRGIVGSNPTLSASERHRCDEPIPTAT